MATTRKQRTRTRPTGGRVPDRTKARSRAGTDQPPTSRATAVAHERRRLAALWLVAASPLVWLPGGFDRFVFPKLVVVAAAGVVGAGLPRRHRLPRAISITLLVGAVLIAIAALAGDTPIASIVGRWPRYEGLPVLGMYAGSLWLGVRLVGRGAVRAVHLAHALAGMSLVLCVASVADALGHSPLGPSSIERSGSLLGNATDQGLVAMMAAVVIVDVLLERVDPLLVGGAVAAVATVALSASRIAIVLAVLGVTATALLRLRRDDAAAGRRAALTTGALVVALASVTLAVPVTRGRLLDGATGGGRLTQWRLTLDLIADHPWLGLGPSRYVDAFGPYESASFVRFTGPSVLADSPHDLVLQTAVAGGLPLLGCLLALVALAVRRSVAVLRTHREAWGPALAAAAYGAAMLANFTSAGSTCLAAFLAGSVLAESVREAVPRPVVAPARAQPDRWRAPAVTTIFAVAALVAAAQCVSEIRLAQGVASASRGATGRAADEIDSAQRWRPLDGDVSMLGAQVMAQAADSGDTAAAGSAISHAHQSLRRTPDSYDSRVALAVALASQDRLTMAESVLDAAIVGFPRRPDAFVQRAVVRAHSGDLGGARADLAVAERIEPRSPVPRQLDRRLQRLIDSSVR